jgi:hypothetical protein
MIGSITPVVYGPPNKLRWFSIWCWYAVGATASAWIFGWILFGASSFLSVYFSRFSFPWPLACLAFLCGLHEFGLLRLPVPQCRRQVPAHWRIRFAPWLYSALYGVVLGPGLFTYIPSALYYVLIGSGVFSRGAGPSAMAIFGFSQTMPALIAGSFTNNFQDLSCVSTGYMRYQGALHRLAGCLLIAFGTSLYWD